MIDGEIELKDKIFIVKKGTRVGKSFVNYRIENCLFILNSSRKAKRDYNKWRKKSCSYAIYDDCPSSCSLFTLEAGHWELLQYNTFESIFWTDFKKRWQTIQKAQAEGKVLSNLDNELAGEDEIMFMNKITSKGW